MLKNTKNQQFAVLHNTNLLLILAFIQNYIFRELGIRKLVLLYHKKDYCL